MDIDKIILALQDAKNRGIINASIIINSSYGNFCQVEIKEISVSDLTGCVFYTEGHEGDFLGFIKHNKKLLNPH